MSEHALLSASSSERWINCPGSVALCKDIPSTTSKFAEEGTNAHELAARLLLNQSTQGIPAIAEMLEEIIKYTNLVTEYTGNGTLMVEKRVDYSENIGVPDSFGTSDAIIVSEDGEEITVIDLKYGKGVRVDAEDNSQLMLYALGAINELSVVYPSIKRVRMVIHQPRLDHISEWDCTIEHLMEFAVNARRSAELAVNFFSDTLDSSVLIPGESQCRFCPAKAICPALSEFVQDNIGGGFEDLNAEISVEVDDSLAAKMKAIPLIEDWCKAVRAKVEGELLSGRPVEGFKLVAGRQGKRNWSDEKAAEDLLKSFRLKKEEMYDMSLISPTSAEKLFKEQPRRWGKVEELIVRKDGAPSVAPVTDKRPALILTAPEAGFEHIEED